MKVVRHLSAGCIDNKSVKNESDTSETSELYNTHKMLTELAAIHMKSFDDSEDSKDKDSEIEELIENKPESLLETIEFDEIQLDLDLSGGKPNEEQVIPVSKIALDKTLSEELYSILGEEMLDSLIQIVRDNFPEKDFRIDIDKVTSIAKTLLQNKFEAEILSKGLGNIYEIWSLVLHERQVEASERKNINVCEIKPKLSKYLLK